MPWSSPGPPRGVETEKPPTHLPQAVAADETL